MLNGVYNLGSRSFFRHGMSGILFIKTSSLGDLVHHMPALTDARRHRPDARIHWVVEEPYAAFARLHPAVDDVLPVAMRRWRPVTYSWSTWCDIGRFRRLLRAQSYDIVVDTQGLLRTAVIALFSRGTSHGYDRRSIREPLASLLYDVRHRVPKLMHAVDRNRRLTASALGYDVQGPIDYGLDRNALARPASERYGIFLHSTTRVQKEWPEENWIALGNRLSGLNARILLPWATPNERARAERIAARLPQASIPDRQPLDQIAGLIAGASFVIGVDTGLLHLAAALRVPTVGIFCGSDPGLTRPVGSGPIAVLGRSSAPPSVDAVVEAALELMRIPA